MVNVTIDSLVDKYVRKSSYFPYDRTPKNIEAAKIIIRLFIHYAFMAAINGFSLTTKSVSSFIRFRVRVYIEKSRVLNGLEKRMYLTSYKKFGYMFRFDFYGNYMGKDKYHFIPDQGMMADLQDTINSNTIYALTHEKSFN